MPLVIFVFLIIQLLVVAYYDFKLRKIPNMWSIINISCYILFIFLFDQIYFFQLETFIVPLAFLFVGYFLFVLKIMGAGDAKYLFSLFLLIPLKFQEDYFLCLAYATVLVGGSLFVTNVLKNFDIIKMSLKTQDVIGLKNIFGKKFTYAPVILISWIWFGWLIRSKLYI